MYHLPCESIQSRSVLMIYFGPYLACILIADTRNAQSVQAKRRFVRGKALCDRVCRKTKCTLPLLLDHDKAAVCCMGIEDSPHRVVAGRLMRHSDDPIQDLSRFLVVAMLRCNDKSVGVVMRFKRKRFVDMLDQPPRQRVGRPGLWPRCLGVCAEPSSRGRPYLTLAALRLALLLHGLRAPHCILDEQRSNFAVALQRRGCVLQRPAVLLDGHEHDLAVALQLLGGEPQRVASLLDGREHDLAVTLQLLGGVPQRMA